jgi:hypothetical protein
LPEVWRGNGQTQGKEDPGRIFWMFNIPQMQWHPALIDP